MKMTILTLTTLTTKIYVEKKKMMNKIVHTKKYL